MGDKKNSGLKKNFIFWTAFIIILSLTFLLSKNRIFRVLGQTDFFNEVFGSTPVWVQKEIDKVMPQEEKNVEVTETEIQENPESILVVSEEKIKDKSARLLSAIINKDDSLLAAIEPVKKNVQKKEAEKKETIVNQAKAENIPQTESKNSQEAKSNGIVKIDEPKKETSRLILCFVMVDGDGAVSRFELERLVPKTMTPLTTSINMLLQGPTIGELEKGYMSMIPEGTRLLSASISNKVATLNFSDDFAVNKYGVEGYITQLMQIVYTATCFSTIDSVQFLIDGQKTEYLGSEGVWIGSPLARSSFR
jgi:spore germination protein GerM